MNLYKINELVRPIVESEGYQFVGAELNLDGHRHRLIIYVDKPVTPINLDECAMLSRRMSAVLDVEGVLSEDKYVLEVSSPGVDRPLFTQAQIIEQVGKNISLQLKTAINGKKNVKGLLLSADETQLVVQLEKDSKKDNKKDNKKEIEEFVIQADSVNKAKLCITDQMFNKSLSKYVKKDRKWGNANEL